MGDLFSQALPWTPAFYGFIYFPIALLSLHYFVLLEALKEMAFVG
jgi:hypothetical protein